MFDHVAHYQFSFFSPEAHVEPSPDNIERLLKAFKDKGFIPTTVQELHVGEDFNTSLHLQMITRDNGWKIDFESKRVLLTKENVPNVSIGTSNEFRLEVEEIFSRLLSIIPFNGTRLSFVTKGLLPEMSQESLKIIHSRFMDLPQFYVEKVPFQWSTRNIAQLDIQIRDKTETINVITDISRIQGSFKEKEGFQRFDRIEVGFDINTYQKNITVRFALEDIGNFLTQAIKISERIQKEIGDKFNE